MNEPARLPGQRTSILLPVVNEGANYFLLIWGIWKKIVEKDCITSTKKLQQYLKLADSEMRSKIANIDKGASMRVLHCVLDSIFKFKMS